MADWLAGTTLHVRKGAVKNRFRYSVDYAHINGNALQEKTSLHPFFGINTWRLLSLWRQDFGGSRDQGRGVNWVHEIIETRDFSAFLRGKRYHITLLAQPRVLGFRFSPVSFWFIWQGDDLVAAIAEVNNTFGDRHCYFCALAGAPIGKDNVITATKIFHVSPFQPIAGVYKFRFAHHQNNISIHIDLTHGEGGVYANLCGSLVPVTTSRILRGFIRRPFGPMRVSLLIYWQAIILKFKGARYRNRPKPPDNKIS